MAFQGVPIKRGDIVDVNLEGGKGTEKANDPTAGSRPCLVIQNDVGNNHSPMTIVVPLTDARQGKYLPIQVYCSAAELNFSGAKDSIVECGHIRTIDRNERILATRGSVTPEVMARVNRALAISLGL